jgi:hypothetical protein
MTGKRRSGGCWRHISISGACANYRPKARPNSVCVVHPKTGEEAWWPLFDETGKELFPELMPELDATKAQTVSGLVFRRVTTIAAVGSPFPG